MKKHFIIFTFLICSLGFAAIPQQINYQGYLTNPSGTPRDTTVAMSFKLYTDSTSGTLLWTEARPSVVVNDGLFHVKLGQGTTLADSILNQTQVWLGIQVGADAEMTPRTRIVSVGYSYRVGTVDGATGGTITSDVNIQNKINVGSGNTNTGSFANVFGQDNTASGLNSSVGGGRFNKARGDYAFVGGGGGFASDSNSAQGDQSVIVGGYHNRTTADYTFVGGGGVNTASGVLSVVSGGSINTASGSNATVCGGAQNLASGSYATVAGGGPNKARGEFAFVGGGGGLFVADSNSAQGDLSAIVGGGRNCATGSTAFVGGGFGNSASNANSVVSGGTNNTASGIGSVISGGNSNIASALYATISGGVSNEASASNTTISGGSNNTASGTGSVISGGALNKARGVLAFVGGGGGFFAADTNSAQGDYSTISGGSQNSASIDYSFVGGGLNNSANDTAVTISGGRNNGSGGRYATIGGGDDNASNGAWATVSGGFDNSASAGWATVPGGANNIASGLYSFAAGRFAQANNTNSFVWSSGADTTLSWGNNTFTARAPGGVRFYTDVSSTIIGASLPAGSGIWAALSDSTSKRRLGTVNTKEILEKVAQLPIERWSYKTQDENIQHIGPMSQHFYNAFQIGEDDKTISTLDPSGIALAAIQELAKQNLKQDEEIAELRSMVQTLIADKKETLNRK